MKTYCANPARQLHDVDLVRNFQQKFGIPMFVYPAMPHYDYLEFRLKRLRAELDEMELAAKQNNYVGVIDALVDLRYLALGTELTMGAPSLEFFEMVHQANMTKKRVDKATLSAFGSSFDVVKPEGWVSPDADLRELIRLKGGLVA